MTEPYEAIVQLLDEAHIQYQKLEHEPVYTSEQAAAVRGTKLGQGAKALLFKTKQGFVLVVLAADKKADSKKLKQYLAVKDLRFATPEEVKEQMGCEIGACYPLGVVAGLRTIVDHSLAQNDEIVFNAGRHDISINMKYRDYLFIAQAETAAIS